MYFCPPFSLLFCLFSLDTIYKSGCKQLLTLLRSDTKHFLFKKKCGWNVALHCQPSYSYVKGSWNGDCFIEILESSVDLLRVSCVFLLQNICYLKMTHWILLTESEGKGGWGKSRAWQQSGQMFCLLKQETHVSGWVFVYACMAPCSLFVGTAGCHGLIIPIHLQGGLRVGSMQLVNGR